MAPTRACCWLLAVLSTTTLASDWRLFNVHVVDIEAADTIANQAVDVSEGRIVWIGPAGEAPRTGAPRMVDGGGGYLMPGLIDAHVHLADPAEYPLYLSAGVTTVVELGGPDHRDWREPLRSGTVAGPRLVTCGPTVSAADPVSAKQAIARHAQAGFDCVKIYDNMPSDVYAALSTVARQMGLPAAAHIPRNLSWEDMLRAAPAAVAHAEEFLYSPCCSESDFRRIADSMRENGVALITTLTTYDNITQQAHDIDAFVARLPAAGYPAVNFRAWQPSLNRYARFEPGQIGKMRSLFRFQQWLVDYLHTAGVSIVMGTDAGNVGTFPGSSVAQELHWLVAAGLTPAEALASATSSAARWLGRTRELGVLKPEAAADLLLLAANPLNDISNVRFVRGVMVNGRWFDAAALAGLREAGRLGLALERQFVARLEAEGITPALSWLEGQSQKLRFGALNELGYQKLKLENAPRDAVAAFRANAALYAKDWKAHASLAEGLLAIDDRTGALDAANQVRQLAPDHPQADAELSRLGLAGNVPER